MVVVPLEKSTTKIYIMKKNINNLDRIIRITIFALALILFITKILTGTIAVVFLIVGTVLMFTSIINFCPIYRLLGINTCKIK